MSGEWSVQLTEERDGWQIVNPDEEVVDTMYFQGLERPADEELRRRVKAAINSYRVVRFAQILEEGRDA